jgi:leucyl aminopeptidase
MDLSLRKADLAARAAGMVVVGVPEGERTLTGPARVLDRATRGAVTTLLQSGDFTGRPLESWVLHAKSVKARRILLVGLGRATERTPQRLLLAAAHAARRAREMGVGNLALALHETPGLDMDEAVRATAEGAVLGHYRHTAYKSQPKPALDRIELLGTLPASRALVTACAHGVARGEAVCLARDLAHTPGQDLVPEGIAERARDIGRAVGAKVTVHDEAALERLGMGGILAVGRGSAHPPRFIVLDKPAETRRGKVPTVVLIGKGVTFDTGGYSLKPREGMSRMKYDMGGAAAVLGVFSALPSLPLPFRLVGLIPSAENMVSSRAFKPGDVLRAHDGTTVEVTNTDAEGRLLLADALGWARTLEPEVVVDLATLTGAISIALGRHYAGLFTADDALAAELSRSGDAVEERLWRMPMGEHYLAEMRSDTADLLNSNEKREGNASTAASFLQHFARGMRWAHLDIASTGWNHAETALAPKGPNGFGVRLLLHWLAERARG